MHIQLPESDAIKATERILAQCGPAKPRVLMQTVFDLDEYVYTVLRAGACGFLLKDSPPATLIEGIRTVVAERCSRRSDRETNLNRAMNKLGISSRAQPAVVAYETGVIRPRRNSENSRLRLTIGPISSRHLPLRTQPISIAAESPLVLN